MNAYSGVMQFRFCKKCNKVNKSGVSFSNHHNLAIWNNPKSEADEAVESAKLGTCGHCNKPVFEWERHFINSESEYFHNNGECDSCDYVHL